MEITYLLKISALEFPVAELKLSYTEINLKYKYSLWRHWELHSPQLSVLSLHKSSISPPDLHSVA